jgi:hypothetical protein
MLGGVPILQNHPNEVHLPRRPGYNDAVSKRRPAGGAYGREYPATLASWRVSEVEGSLIYQSNAAAWDV